MTEKGGAVSRTNVLIAAKELAEDRIAQREGESTLVKRGAINWATHDWDHHPRALAIMADDTALFPGTKGFRDGNFTFEYFSVMPEQEGVPQINDQLMEELINDVAWIVSQLERTKNKSGQAIVSRIDRTNARVVESHDITLKVQGIVVSLNMDF